MASLYPYSYSFVSRARRNDGGRLRHRSGEALRHTSLIAVMQVIGLAGAMAFISLFAVFSVASVAEPLARAVVVGVFLVPMSVLVYFMREAAGALRLDRLERRAGERRTGLVIDV